MDAEASVKVHKEILSSASVRVDSKQLLQRLLRWHTL